MELDDVMTTSEAAERWGLARDTVEVFLPWTEWRSAQIQKRRI